MGVNTNVEEISRNANVENTTRQGNTYDGADPPVMLREGPEDQPDELLASEEAASYDPGDHTVDEVKAYVTEHPEIVDDVIAAEEAGKNRVTLLTWLVNQE